jgi:high-affinity iron transporter
LIISRNAARPILQHRAEDHVRFLPFFLAAAFLVPAAARADDASVQTAWRLLDYLAVDYPGAVADGRVVSTSEYAEMREFSASVSQRIAALPANPQRAALVAEARRLEAAIAGRTAPAQVERLAHGLAGRLLAAYPVPLAPGQVPDLVRGAQLYAQHCAACHGATGHADTVQARALDPHPVAFADLGRARHRSLFGLYQVIGQGLEGTAMQSFAQLPDQDRWALAFYVGRFAYPDALAKRGAALWRGDPSLHTRIANIETLVGMAPDALARQLGEERANQVTAFLRATPGAVMQREGAQSLSVSRDLLGQSVAAYRRGERDHAGELALAAYLDGFEPVEALLNARDAGVVARVERASGEYRAAIHNGAPVAEIERRAADLESLFGEAERALAPEAGGGTSTFLGAFAILLREGLEALLIVVAMITFLIRAERRDLLRWVHIGWVGALAAGVATWWIASNLLTISGAGRELTEGFGSLLAAAVLLFVGIWMHGKAQAGAWQAYVKVKLDKALAGGSAWFLFGLAFVAVYREVFETILFFAAMGAEGNGLALGGGIAAAAALLALTAWAMLRFSAKLPIAKFFAYSAALIAVLAVVLAGKGFAALQESGLIGVTPLDGFPRSLMLGIFPTLETILAQAVTIALLALGFLVVHRRPARATV